MNEPRIRTVLIAGAGSSGIGVARSFAKAGFSTQVLSRNPARLQGLLGDVEILDKLPSAAPDLIIESIPEHLDLKIRLYRELEDAYQGASILATNTSGLPLEDLAHGLRHPRQFLGTHYLYPADLSEFVEVIRTKETDDTAVDCVVLALRRCEKTPIVLNRPVIGAMINRLSHALAREAYYLIDEGIVSAEQVDDIARRHLGPRMCVMGLLMQKDISGLDTHALAQRAIVPHLCRNETPSKTLQTLYEHGHFGLKTGKGFYDWSKADVARVRSTVAHKLAQIDSLMKQLESIPNGDD